MSLMSAFIIYILFSLFVLFVVIAALKYTGERLTVGDLIELTLVSFIPIANTIVIYVAIKEYLDKTGILNKRIL